MLSATKPGGMAELAVVEFRRIVLVADGAHLWPGQLILLRCLQRPIQSGLDHAQHFSSGDKEIALRRKPEVTTNSVDMLEGLAPQNCPDDATQWLVG